MVAKGIQMRAVNVMRYITPLREGGSLPAIAEADDDFMYVVKFRGAGQGAKALVAELVAGEIARLLGFKVPEIVFANLDVAFGRSEPDEEIQDLLKASTGLNLGLHYLSGAAIYDPVVNFVDNELASKVVWFDCFVANVDRTFRNTNMLVWHKELWLIDHGAAFYFHHNWDTFEEQSIRPFKQVKDHVFLSKATALETVDRLFRERLTVDVFREIVSLIPDDWLVDASTMQSPAEKREVYIRFLEKRLLSSDIFVNEANHARETFI